MRAGGNRRKWRMRREPNSPIDVKTFEFLTIFDFSQLVDTLEQTQGEKIGER